MITGGIGEQVGVSVASSVVGAGLWACWRHATAPTLYGCLLAKGKTYAERNLTEKENLLFFDIDGSISVEPLHKIEKAKLRLEVYPEATKKLREFIKEHPRKNIVIMSCDYELLKTLGLKKKTHAFIPTENHIVTNYKDEERGVMERLSYQYQLVVKKKKQEQYNNHDVLTEKMYKVYGKGKK